MPCENCKGNRFCAQKNEEYRKVFFAMARGQAITVTCADYDPQWFRGIEGVAA